MNVNIQYEEADRLIWELFGEIPAEKKKRFSERVNRISSELFHPTLCGDVVFPFGGNGTTESSAAL